jgi:hypothetical protein
MLINSLSAVLIFLVSHGIDKELDLFGSTQMTNFWYDFKRTAKDVFQIRKNKIVLRILLFIALRGLLVPRF